MLPSVCTLPATSISPRIGAMSSFDIRSCEQNFQTSQSSTLLMGEPFQSKIRIEDDMHTTHPKTDQVLVANSDLPSTFTCCLGSCWIHPGFGADFRNNHEDD